MAIKISVRCDVCGKTTLVTPDKKDIVQIEGCCRNPECPSNRIRGFRFQAVGLEDAKNHLLEISGELVGGCNHFLVISDNGTELIKVFLSGDKLDDLINKLQFLRKG